MILFHLVILIAFVFIFIMFFSYRLGHVSIKSEMGANKKKVVDLKKEFIFGNYNQ